MSMLHQSQLAVSTGGRGFIEITDKVQREVELSGLSDGLCTVFVLHTSASVMITENADPDVLRDLETWISGAVRDGDPAFLHRAEGPDDMPAHVRSVLTQTSIGIPVRSGRLELGTWQGLFLWEHRQAAHRRRISVTLIGASNGPD